MTNLVPQGPVHQAAQWGQDAVVTSLIEHGADINRQDADGKTALHHAIENGHSGIINLLLGKTRFYCILANKCQGCQLSYQSIPQPLQLRTNDICFKNSFHLKEI